VVSLVAGPAGPQSVGGPRPDYSCRLCRGAKSSTTSTPTSSAGTHTPTSLQYDDSLTSAVAETVGVVPFSSSLRQFDQYVTASVQAMMCWPLLPPGREARSTEGEQVLGDPLTAHVPICRFTVRTSCNYRLRVIICKFSSNDAGSKVQREVQRETGSCWIS